MFESWTPGARTSTDPGWEFVPTTWSDAQLSRELGAHLSELLRAEPGGILAAAVEDAAGTGVEADLSDSALVDLAAGAQRLAGWAIGAQLCAIAELARRWERRPGGLPVPDGPFDPATYRGDLGHSAVVAEVALASGLSEYAAWQRLDAALELPDRLPHTWELLRVGRLEWAKAVEILRQTQVLGRTAGERVENDVLPVALEGNLPQLRAALARAIATADPEGAAERAREAAQRRDVRFSAGPDATGSMTLTAPAADVATAQACLDELAAAAAGPHDPRPAGAVRADVLLDLIVNAARHREHGPQPESVTRTGPCSCRSGRSPGTAEVLLLLPYSTAMNLDQTPAELVGFGPIPATVARELATTGVWRCAVTDDRPGAEHGTLLALGRSTYTPNYAPGAAARDFVSLRDQTCVFPGCRRSAHRCDLDHRTRWRSGSSGTGSSPGATCECNLQALCRRHHRLKHEAGFSVARQASPGAPAGAATTADWTTPTGRQYARPPTALIPSMVPPPTTGQAEAPRPAQLEEAPF